MVAVAIVVVIVVSIPLEFGRTWHVIGNGDGIERKMVIFSVRMIGIGPELMLLIGLHL